MEVKEKQLSEKRGLEDKFGHILPNIFSIIFVLLAPIYFIETKNLVGSIISIAGFIFAVIVLYDIFFGKRDEDC